MLVDFSKSCGPHLQQLRLIQGALLLIRKFRVKLSPHHDMYACADSVFGQQLTVVSSIRTLRLRSSAVCLMMSPSSSLGVFLARRSMRELLLAPCSLVSFS